MRDLSPEPEPVGVMEREKRGPMRDGVRGALLAVFETHYDELIAFARRKVECPALAADIVQESYARLAGGPPAADVRNPRAFLYRIVGNRAVDHLRQHRSRSKYMMPEPPSEEIADRHPSAEAVIDARQRLALLARAVDELPPRCRQVFVLRKVEGMDQADIARLLGISRNMVEKHLRKALLHCAARLQDGD